MIMLFAQGIPVFKIAKSTPSSTIYRSRPGA